MSSSSEHVPSSIRREAQRLLEEVSGCREDTRDRLRTASPRGYWRDVVSGKELPATKAELRECDRLLAKHRDVATKQPVPATAPKHGGLVRLHHELREDDADTQSAEGARP